MNEKNVKYEALQIMLRCLNPDYFDNSLAYLLCERLYDMAFAGTVEKIEEKTQLRYLWFCFELYSLGIIEEFLFKCFVYCVAPERYDYLFAED